MTYIYIYDRHIYATNTMVNAITEVLDGELKCTKTLIAFAESKFLFGFFSQFANHLVYSTQLPHRLVK